jgi:hypothetical protein
VHSVEWFRLPRLMSLWWARSDNRRDPEYGAQTLEAVSSAPNQRGVRLPRGGRWHASSVSNLLARAINWHKRNTRPL